MIFLEKTKTKTSNCSQTIEIILKIYMQTLNRKRIQNRINKPLYENQKISPASYLGTGLSNRLALFPLRLAMRSNLPGSRAESGIPAGTT